LNKDFNTSIIKKETLLLTGINILVVEDSILNQKIVNFMLNKQNATVKNAINGSEAIEQLKVNDFDVILMDLQMPGMDGFATSRYIRNEMKNNIPIIALTADIFVSETSECLDAGMNASISKPFEIEDLSKIILGLVKEKKTNALNRPV
jgi:CheY-like chemotaxis protein